MRSDRRRVVVKRLQVSYAESERRVCKALNFPRASHRYKSVRDERAELRIRLRDLASTRVDFGYRRLHIFLLREGWCKQRPENVAPAGEWQIGIKT